MFFCFWKVVKNPIEIIAKTSMLRATQVSLFSYERILDIHQSASFTLDYFPSIFIDGTYEKDFFMNLTFLS